MGWGNKSLMAKSGSHVQDGRHGKTTLMEQTTRTLSGELQDPWSSCFTLVFGVRIYDCTISSNHHHCILFSFSVPLQGGNIYCQTGIQEIQIFKATNEY